MNKRKILIVEDENNLRAGLILALSSDTIEAMEASTIKEARELFHIHAFDLILLDYNLPDGKGIIFCKFVRSTSDIPIIFLTVNDEEIDIVSAFKVGATDYVTKPFSVMVLRERVNAALRLSIARAILRNSPILILDEATSALDTKTEQEIQSALDEISKERTTLVIAHRLSTIRHADQIVVLEGSGIAEIGKHEELIAGNGIYARLHAAQVY